MRARPVLPRGEFAERCIARARARRRRSPHWIVRSPARRPGPARSAPPLPANRESPLRRRAWEPTWLIITPREEYCQVPRYNDTGYDGRLGGGTSRERAGSRHPEAIMVRDAAYVGLLLVLEVSALSAQRTANGVYDRVLLGGHVMDPASQLDAVRNIGLTGGRIAVVTTHAIRGRDTVDAHGLVVAPGFIDLHAHGQPAETYRFYSLDGVTTALELELGTSDVAAWYRERSGGEQIK